MTAPRGSIGRNDAVDFFRGLGLWMIYVDHVDGNVWSRLTLRPFGFSDFAEIFVFLSGYIGAGMYARALDRGGWFAALRKLGSRMLRLYLAHLATLASVIAVLGMGVWLGIRLTDTVMYVWRDRPWEYCLRILTLFYAPNLFSLLPLYVVCSPILLAAVAGLRRAPRLTLFLSFAIWTISQFHRFDPNLIPGSEAWYFRPSAWQFLFVIGAASSAYPGQVNRAVRSRACIATAWFVVAVSFLLKVAVSFEAVRDRLSHWGVPVRLLQVDGGKPRLAPHRLIHFFALAILVASFIAHHRGWLRWAISRAAIACGRRSLLIYSVSLVITALANLLLMRYQTDADTLAGAFVQLVYTGVGLAIMWLIAARYPKLPESRQL